MTALPWQKSSYSSDGSACVELATAPARSRPRTVLLRESDDPDRVLRVPGAALCALLARLKGERERGIGVVP